MALKVCEYLEDPKTAYIHEHVETLTGALETLEADGESAKEVNDYIILATALHYNLTLTTFDKKLKRRALEKGIKVVP